MTTDVRPGEREHVSLVDWGRVGRRMGLSAVALVVLALAAWLVSGLTGDGLTLRGLANWLGLAVGLLFVAEVVLVGGAAARGLLRAGERGERLAGGDVGMLPPQLTRRRRRE